MSEQIDYGTWSRHRLEIELGERNRKLSSLRAVEQAAREYRAAEIAEAEKPRPDDDECYRRGRALIDARKTLDAALARVAKTKGVCTKCQRDMSTVEGGAGNVTHDDKPWCGCP